MPAIFLNYDLCSNQRKHSSVIDSFDKLLGHRFNQQMSGAPPGGGK